MIQINLLPPEYRRAQRTAPSTLALLLVSTLLGFGSLCTAGYLFFNVRSKAQNKVDILREQLDNMTMQVRYADALEKEKAEFEKRNKTIQEIASSRILWTPKLDRLGEIVNRDALSARHQVWLDQIKIDAKVDSKNRNVTFTGYSSGPQIESVSNFHEDLSKDEIFAKGFEAFEAPSSEKQDPDDGIEPATKMKFDFSVKLPTIDVKKDKVAPARKTAAATESK